MCRLCAPGNRLPLSPNPSPWLPGRDLIPALVRELTQPLLCALLLSGPQWQSPSPPGRRVKGALSKVKARPAATWGFFPAEHELCNRIVKDHGSGRKSERPHRSARGRIYFTARNTDRPRISGRGDAGFRDAGMWQKQNTPHPSTPSLPECGGKGVQGHCAPDFSVPHISVRSGVAYPSTGEKQDLKTLYFCGFSIKDHQRATW